MGKVCQVCVATVQLKKQSITLFNKFHYTDQWKAIISDTPEAAHLAIVDHGHGQMEYCTLILNWTRSFLPY
jgi:hypothetical protein